MRVRKKLGLATLVVGLGVIVPSAIGTKKAYDILTDNPVVVEKHEPVKFKSSVSGKEETEYKTVLKEDDGISHLRIYNEVGVEFEQQFSEYDIDNPGWAILERKQAMHYRNLKRALLPQLGLDTVNCSKPMKDGGLFTELTVVFYEGFPKNVTVELTDSRGRRTCFGRPDFE